MAKGEYNVSDNKESENGNAIQDRVEIVNGNNNEAANDDTDGYVGYGFKKDESINMKFTLPLIGIIHFDVMGKLLDDSMQHRHYLKLYVGKVILFCVLMEYMLF